MKITQVALIIVLFGGVIALACTGPLNLLGSDSTAQVDGAGTPLATSTIAATPGDSGDAATTYPGPSANPTGGAPTTYPGPATLPPPIGADQPYPGVTQVPSLPTPPPSPTAYPGPEDAGAVSPTPVIVISPTITPEGVDPYPGHTPTPTSVIVGSVTPQPTVPPLVYTVQRGDTCLSIALAHSVTVDSIIEANDLPPYCGTFTLGQQLLIPQPPFTTLVTPTDVLVDTPTPFSSPTPAPTATATPVPTPTAPPPPPWVVSNLQATDPDTVELASGRVQLIWFFAFWDGPSKAMAPLVHGLETQYGDRMNFVYLDIDDPRTDSFKSLLGYRSQPHFFLLDRNGDTLHQWRGYVSVEEFQRAFEAALQ